MNKQRFACGRFTLLAVLVSSFACTQSDSLGSGGRDEGAADASVADVAAPPLGGSGGAGGLAVDTRGTTVLTGGQSGATSHTGGAAGGASGAGGASASDGAVFTRADGGVDAPVPDGGVDAPAWDSAAGGCGDPNPAQVGCVGPGQCVPSSCYCSAEGTWRCTTDCRSGLPPCDAGVSPDTSGSGVDGAVACSATTATLTVAPGSELDAYCLAGCGLPLKLFKDGSAIELTDYVRPECGTCIQPPRPSCLSSGLPVTEYSYTLSQRFVVGGKCGNNDCSSTTCLESGRYKVVYYVYAKQPDGTCGGTPIELAAEFNYPKTTKVELRFSTLTSCARNADCMTGKVCFHGVSSNTCTPSSDMCTSREPSVDRCVCPGCTCSGTDNADSFWGCVI